jgi:hypothetical protein
VHPGQYTIVAYAMLFGLCIFACLLTFVPRPCQPYEAV